MAKVPKFHTKTEEEPGQRDVHHDNDACFEGQKIKAKNREPGDNGKPLCKVCAKL